jgi:hypothetical protein
MVSEHKVIICHCPASILRSSLLRRSATKAELRRMNARTIQTCPRENGEPNINILDFPIKPACWQTSREMTFMQNAIYIQTLMSIVFYSNKASTKSAGSKS